MDYQEQTVAGKSWTRVFQINMSNNYGQVPAVAFVEEERVTLENGKTYGSFKGAINTSYEDPAKQCQLRDPSTDEVLSPEACSAVFASMLAGIMTDQQFYCIVYSRARQAQIDRDQAEA